jgi:hypothetical protein
VALYRGTTSQLSRPEGTVPELVRESDEVKRKSEIVKTDSLLARAASILDQSMITLYVSCRSREQRRALQSEQADLKSAVKGLRSRLSVLREAA